MSEICNLAKKGGSERGHRKKRVDFTAKKGRFQGRKIGQAKRASLGESMSE